MPFLKISEVAADTFAKAGLTGLSGPFSTVKTSAVRERAFAFPLHSGYTFVQRALLIGQKR
jgi:hypothetical protein